MLGNFYISSLQQVKFHGILCVCVCVWWSDEVEVEGSNLGRIGFFASDSVPRVARSREEIEIFVEISPPPLPIFCNFRFYTRFSWIKVRLGEKEESKEKFVQRFFSSNSG